MPTFPAPGLFLPGYLNQINSPGPSGQQDAYGLNYPTAMVPGKGIQLSTSEATAVTAPGTPQNQQLLDGSYQIVLLDSGATAIYATQGLAAYIKLDSGPTQGAIPETAYAATVVTTEDQASNVALFAGVFLNPSSINGVPNGPTPGNYTAIWVGGGRCWVLLGGQNANGAPAIGDNIEAAGHNYNTLNGYGTFTDRSAASTAPTGYAVGQAANLPVAAANSLLYSRNIFYRIGNQGV